MSQSREQCKLEVYNPLKVWYNSTYNKKDKELIL